MLVTAQHGLKCLNDLQRERNVTSRKTNASHYQKKKKIEKGEEGGRKNGREREGLGKREGKLRVEGEKD